MSHRGRLAARFRQLALGGCVILMAGGDPVLSAPNVPVPAPGFDISPVPALQPASPLPEGWQHGAFMEIFVRSYKDSDGDGIGDLRGVIESLDYLHELGVRGLWLMPVTPSQDRDHGYAVTDYRNIEPAYGTLSDFDELIDQAHARGIGVIVDYVVNHSAAAHPLFQQSASSPGNRFRHWYAWRDPAPADWQIFRKNPWVPTATGSYLAQFSVTMPDFNLLEPRVMAFHEDNLRFWLNRGVDGFRFDAVTHLVENGPDSWQDQPQNYPLMGRLSRVIHAYPRRYVVCEATRNAPGYAAASACGGAFALDNAVHLAGAARGEANSIQAVADYFRSAPESMAAMVSNHDLFAGERLWDQVGGDLAQYRLAAATYLLQPGTPFIYYGEEIGMSAATGLKGDAKLRVPMSWSGDALHAGFSTVAPYRVPAANVAAQNVQAELSREGGLLAWYRALLGLRNRHGSLARGAYEDPVVDGQVLSYRRRLGNETAVVLVNYGKRAASVTVRGLAPGMRLVQRLPASAPVRAKGIGANGKLRVRLSPQSLQVFVSQAQ